MAAGSKDITMTRPPQHVLRFYGNIQYALECVGCKQITLLHIDKLNDPFDSHLSFETDFNDDYQALIDYVQKHRTKDIQKFKELLPKENWERYIEGIENCSQKNRNSMFIFSTSEISEDSHPKDNLYLWSHYGNGHRGVAIEFDVNLLANAVLEQQRMLGGVDIDLNEILFEIKYPNEIPLIKCEHIVNFVLDDIRLGEKDWMKKELGNILRERSCSKSIGWKIEKEWRLWRYNDETRLKVQRLDLIDDTITAVYFGFRYPLIDDHKNDDLIFETKRHFPKAKIFKAKQRKGKSALDFEQIVVATNKKT
jgi:hypothetical protein